jgi:hypothetical protein
LPPSKRIEKERKKKAKRTEKERNSVTSWEGHKEVDVLSTYNESPLPLWVFRKKNVKKRAISKDFDFEDLQNPQEHYTFALSKENNPRFPIIGVI